MSDFVPLVDIEIEHEAWEDALPQASELVRLAIEASFAHLGAKEQLDVVVLLTNDDEMKALNKTFRQKEKPTNVLSFPAPEMMHPHLGDIALGYETCIKEANAQGKSLKDHLLHLTVHGSLHLLGYDHLSEPEANEMEALEREILKGLAVADPYAYTER
jgi:probable rRNA maturation factor